MLARPDCSDSQRLPNAVAIVIALKITARVSVDCKRLDLEGNSDPKR